MYGLLRHECIYVYTLPYKQNALLPAHVLIQKNILLFTYNERNHLCAAKYVKPPSAGPHLARGS